MGFLRGSAEEGIYCSLRLWNGGGSDSRNGEILSFLEEKLGYDPMSVTESRNHSRSFSKYLFLECEDQFDWPDMDAGERRTVLPRPSKPDRRARGRDSSAVLPRP